MENYAETVAVLSFLVDFLLLLGTSRLCGYPPGFGKTLLAASLGGVYGGACLTSGFRFLGSIVWRVVSMGLMGWIAFGWNKSALRRTAVFTLLCMSMSGVAAVLESDGFWSVAVAVVCVAALCFMSFRGRTGGASYVPVELSYGDKRLELTALRDTGNTLRDPVTGRSVLVVGADVAQELTGLTKQQLSSPIEAMTAGVLPGLRLIPYHSIGQPAGLLLALRLPQVRIGAWQGSSLVAFAPEGLSREGTYQALTGGAV